MYEFNTVHDAAARRACATAPLSLAELVQRLERRLAWYGLPRSGLRNIEVRNDDTVVATVTVAGNGTFREEFDRRTGWVCRREAVACAA